MVKLEKGNFLSESKKEDIFLLQSGFGKKTAQGVVLHPLEAAYIADMGIAKIKREKKSMDAKSILKIYKSKKNKSRPARPSAMPAVPEAEEQYILYKQIRSGGRIVRFFPNSPQYWRVHARGVGREQERAQTLVRLVNIKWKASLDGLERELATARALRMEFVLGYVEKGKANWIKLGKYSLD
ncbi:MAG: hypothetical protein ABIH83_04585 [Candidatus Micrarchaeota archaeon]